MHDFLRLQTTIADLFPMQIEQPPRDLMTIKNTTGF
jgi:hypothetical protein